MRIRKDGAILNHKPSWLVQFNRERLTRFLSVFVFGLNHVRRGAEQREQDTHAAGVRVVLAMPTDVGIGQLL